MFFPATAPKKKRLALLMATALLLAAQKPEVARAGDLVYQPINPSFGGNPFYSAHLLGLAGLENQFKPTTTKKSPLDDFATRIESALLSRVASQVADKILGENAVDSGTFRVDSTEINFHRDGAFVVIDIIDGVTGGKTQIEIPAPTL